MWSVIKHKVEDVQVQCTFGRRMIYILLIAFRCCCHVVIFSQSVSRNFGISHCFKFILLHMNSVDTTELCFCVVLQQMLCARYMRHMWLPHVFVSRCSVSSNVACIFDFPPRLRQAAWSESRLMQPSFFKIIPDKAVEDSRVCRSDLHDQAWTRQY